MPRAEQRKAAARRHLERQRAARAEQDARRRRTTLIVASSGVVLIIALAVAFIVQTTGEDGTPAPQGYTPHRTSGPCGYASVDPTGSADIRDVGLPPDPTPTPRRALTVRFDTNRGVIEARLDGTQAPCNVQAMAFLVGKRFYDNTPCPRVVDGGIYVVQCGSGGSTTSGGPAFTVPDENLDRADYAAGAIAMANTGQPNSASSQFFFITKDSNGGLQKSYTVLGHVTRGLGILQKVAAGGNDGSSGSVGGGAPRLRLVFRTVRIVG